MRACAPLPFAANGALRQPGQRPCEGDTLDLLNSLNGIQTLPIDTAGALLPASSSSSARSTAPASGRSLTIGAHGVLLGSAKFGDPLAQCIESVDRARQAACRVEGFAGEPVVCPYAVAARTRGYR